MIMFCIQHGAYDEDEAKEDSSDGEAGQEESGESGESGEESMDEDGRPSRKV